MIAFSKRLSFILLLTTIGLVLAGCNKKNTTGEQAGSDTTNTVLDVVAEDGEDNNTKLIVDPGSVDQVSTGEDSPVSKSADDIVANQLANDLADKADVVIDITGNNFSFSPSRIEAKKGDVVKINFSSEVGLHDRVLDGTENIATEQINPGETTSVTFIAGSPGEYVFYCSVGNHREQGMVGAFVVSE